LKRWQERTETSAGDIDIWAKTYPSATNTGMLCTHCPTLDIDILDAEAVDAAIALVRERFGDRGKVMLRHGLRPKVAIPFRCDVPFDKTQILLTAPGGGADGQKLEFLCRGQQVVVHGIHPDTHAPYQWFDGSPSNVKHDELPLIDAAGAAALIEAVADLLTRDHGYQRPAARDSAASGGNGADDAWGQLTADILAGRDLHDSLLSLSAKLIASGMEAGAAVNYLRGLMDRSQAPRDKRWQERFDDIPRLVKGAGKFARDPDAEIARLAKLPLFEFETQRKLAAEALDIRASMLDKLVNAKRVELGLSDDVDKQGKQLKFSEIKPWPTAVDGAALLDEIDSAFGNYIVMSAEARTTTALWVVHAHIFDRFAVTPRLCVRSATRDCGKTTLFDVLARLTPKCLMAASVTAAVIFRTIELHRPTLLIDEGAGMFDAAGELRRILNAGYRFDGAVLRSVGDNFEPRMFQVFAPVGFALIGTLPSDLHSRCVCIDLKRKLASEKVGAYRVGRTQHLDALAAKIARWTADNANAIAKADPVMPDSLINRRGDLWAVLLSIARVAGGNWVTRTERPLPRLRRAMTTMPLCSSN
jgi:putative DNA primase/helicase